MSTAPDVAKGDGSTTTQDLDGWLVEVLRGEAAEARDDERAAMRHFEIGLLLEGSAREADRRTAAEAFQEAFRRARRAPHVLRAFRRVAPALGLWDDLLIALETEARLEGMPQHRASLEAERGRMIEERFGHAIAARAAYLAALRASPQCVEALIGLERLFRREGQEGHANEMLSQRISAVESPALRATALAALARAEERGGRLDSALEHAVAAAALDPSSLAAAFALERLLRRAGRAGEQLVALRAGAAAGRLDPARAAFARAALSRWHVRDDDAAAGALALAARAQTPADRACALGELASHHARRGASEEESGVLATLIDVEPSPVRRARAGLRLARLRDAASDDEGALGALERALGDDPTHVGVLQALGRRYGERGQRDRLLAMHLAEGQYGAQASERAASLRRAAEMRASDGALDEAIALCERALEAVPGDLSVSSTLERLLERAGLLESLAALLEAQLAAATTPERRGSLSARLGRLYADALDRPDAAIEAYQRVVALGERPAEATWRLVELYERTDRKDELAQALDRLAAAESDPAARASTLERLAEVLGALGRTDEALEVLMRAVAIAPPSHAVFPAAGRAADRAGRPELLAKVWRTQAAGADDDRERAALLCRAAELLDRTGQRDEALVCWQEARRLCPQLRDALEPLSEVYARLRDVPALREVMEELPSRSATEEVRRGVLADAAGDPAVAVASYAAARALGVTLPDELLLGALCLLGRWEEALELLAQPLPSESDGVRAYRLYRAAEIAWGQRGEAERALALLDEALVSAPDDVSALALWIEIAESSPAALDALPHERRIDRTRSLARAVPPGLDRVPLLRRVAHLCDEVARDAEAAQALEEAWSFAEGDPVVAADLDTLYVRLGHTAGRAALAGSLADDARAHPSARLGAALVLGETLVCEQRHADAAEVLERGIGISGATGSLLARLRLVMLSARLGRRTALSTHLGALLDEIDDPAARATVLRHLGRAALDLDRDAALARERYEAALRIEPGDLRTLAALEALHAHLGEDRAALLEPLARAADTLRGRPGTAPAILAALACKRAVRLIDLRREDEAATALDEALGIVPEHPAALRIALALAGAQGATASVLRFSRAVALAETSTTEERAQAFGAWAGAARTLGDAEALREAAEALEARGATEPLLAQRRLDVERALGDPRRLVAAIETEAARPDLDEDRRAELDIELAGRLEQLEDLTGAVDALARAAQRTPRRRHQAAERLFALGESTGRWDTVAEALETALEREGDVEPRWQLAMRQKLAALLAGPLERPDAALRQFQRIAELDPGRAPTDQLATLYEQAGQHDRAIEAHRRLLEDDPKRIESYRAIRRIAVERNLEDLAFCAEAALGVLGIASEDEAYFYRQRRAALRVRPLGALQPEEIRALGATPPTRGERVMAVIAPALGAVFPVDLDGYGALPEDEPVPRTVAELVEGAARLVGLARYRVRLLPSTAAPTVEQGDEPLLLLPVRFDERRRRAQAYAIGELCALAALGGAHVHPKRLDPVGDRLLELIVRAALEIGGAPAEPGDAIYRDLRSRLDRGIDEGARAALVKLATDPPEPFEPAVHRARLLELGARVGMLAAQDPAEAAVAPVELRGALDVDPARLCAFMVSTTHLGIRMRLGLSLGARS